MIDPQGVAFSRMAADATLTALLAEFQEAPAIFEDGQVPPEFQFGSTPIAVVASPAHQGDDDTFDADMRREQITVRLYHRAEGSSLPLQAAAEQVRALFKNWGPSAITGGTMVNATVSGPLPAPTEDPTLDGRIVYLTMLIKET